MYSSFAPLISEIEDISPLERRGHVTATHGGLVDVSGLSSFARVGDLVEMNGPDGVAPAEILSLSEGIARVLPAAGPRGTAIGDVVRYIGDGHIRPDISWVGRVIDAYGRPLDGRPMAKGPDKRSVLASPPEATSRRRLGPRVETGLAAFNTFLPIVRGQRIGLFAGSGVGKSTLLAQLAQSVAADFIVIALIGERGREVREFIEDTLGADGLARSVVVAATSDQSPVARRRASWTAMAVAEYLRDQGGHVLFLADSVTRFCEAHREIALSTGEPAGAQGYPASTAQQVMSLCERAGTGPQDKGDITAIFSVLVAGSDMDEPVADMVRGVLDGHVILDRNIAERGRFPAIDILRSVSRSFTKAHSAEAQEIISAARAQMSVYAQSELMIQAGLYKPGADAAIDQSIRLRPKLESFLSGTAQPKNPSGAHDLARLAEILTDATPK